MKICMVMPKNIFIRNLINLWTKAFKSFDIQVLELEIDENIFDQKVLEVVNKFNPSFVITYDYYAINYMVTFANMGSRCIFFFNKNPMMLLFKDLKDEIIKNNHRYLHFVTDTQWGEALKELGIENVNYIPMAVDTLNYYPIESISKNYDISFQGSISIEDSRLSSSSDILDDFVDNVIDMKISNINTAVSEICEDLFQVNYYKAFNQLKVEETLSFYNNVYSFIDKKGTSVFRNIVLYSLDNYKVNLYGVDVPNNGKFIFNKGLNYGLEQNEVWQSNKVNLFVDSFSREKSTSCELFNCFSSGAFMITDYKSDLRDLLPDFHEHITFVSLDDLQEKIDRVVNDDYYRYDIVSEVRNSIINNFSYDKVAKMIVSLL